MNYKTTDELVEISNRCLKELDNITFGEAVFVMTLLNQKIKSTAILHPLVDDRPCIQSVQSHAQTADQQ